MVALSLLLLPVAEEDTAFQYFRQALAVCLEVARRPAAVEIAASSGGRKYTGIVAHGALR